MSFKCSECSYTSTQSSSVKRHELSRHSDLRPWKCAHYVCNFAATSNNNLKIHMLTHEKRAELKRPHACTYGNCEFRAAHKTKLKAHVSARHTTKREKGFQCPFCPSKSYTRCNLKAHITTHVREKQLRCSQCEFRTDTHSHLALHVRAIHEKIRRNCSFPGCNFSTAYSSHFYRHLRSHDPDPLVRKGFPCSFPNCVFRTSSHGQLKQHIKVHNNPDRIRKFPCSFCRQTFMNKFTLESHIRRSHTNEEDYHRCDKCEYVTHYSYDLKRHVAKVHLKEEPRFNCELCDFKTDRGSLLDRHVKTKHLKENELKCKSFGCLFATNYPQQLKLHSLIHETDPVKRFPVPCQFPRCDFRRRLPVEIRAHSQVHATAKVQFECKLCPTRCYPDLKSLRFHNYLVHGIPDPYKCVKCSYTATEKLQLLRHGRKCHDDNIVENVRTADSLAEIVMPMVLLQRTSVQVI